MNETIKALIQQIIFTLDSVTVSGEQNMDKISGCIKALRDILNSKDKEE